MNGRTLVIEHPLRAEWKLADSLKPAETSANTYRFKIQAASKQTQKLEVEEYKQLENSVYINNLDNDVISTYLNEKSIPVSLEKTLRDIVMQKGVINGIGLKTQSKNREIETINNDQSRVRENMKALKGSAEEKALIERYTRQLNTQEDQLESLRKEVVALNQQYQQEQAKLDKMIMDLNLEENM